jgi:segregation and condensation protein B
MLKAKIEALIYAAEEPISLDQLTSLLKEDLLALKTAAAPQSQGESGESHPAASHDAPVEHDPEATPAAKRAQQKLEKAELRALLKPFLEELIAESAREDRGIEVRQVAGGYRMSTKPEHHDVVRAFAKSLKPPIRLSLPALETLAVIAYKQPVTVPEIGEIRGVDASAVIGTLLDRKLITTAGRKAVVGRPMLYKTSKDFLLRFGLKDLSELPSLEEFEKLAAAGMEEDLVLPSDALPSDAALADATGVPDEGGVEASAEDRTANADSDPGHDPASDETTQRTPPENNGV